MFHTPLSGMTTTQLLEERLKMARAALVAHEATPCDYEPGSLRFRAFFGKRKALQTAVDNAQRTLDGWERPDFDTPIFHYMQQSEEQSCTA